MQTTGSSRPSHPEGGATATPPLAFATAEAAAAAAARPPEPPPVVVPPVEVPRLSPQELKKLTAGKPAAEAEALRAQLQEVLEFVDEAQGMSSRWRAEAIRVTARLQDWREGLLPSSSLVQRAKEVCTARDAEIEAEEEAAAAVAAAAEESKEELENAGTAGAAALAAPLPPIVEAPPLPPPPPPPAEPEPAQELELMAVVVPETRKQEEGDKGQWAAVWDSTYDSTYWYNAKTGETTWEMPAGIKPSPAPAAPAPAPAQAAAVAAEGGATSASSNGSSANGRDLASPVPVTGVGGDALLLYNGERPFVQTAEAVIRLFAGAGPRQVRDLGAGYFCVVFANPGGGAKGALCAVFGWGLHG